MASTLHENLNLLAESILPLDKWLAGTPSQRANVLAPWREPFTPRLSLRDLGLIDFIERRIDDSAGDDSLARKWEQVAQDPLAVFNRLPDRGPAWRAARNLSPAPDFGIIESGNVEVVLDNVQSGEHKIKRASSRREFYGHAFAAFAKVVAANPPADWDEFREKLLRHGDDPALGWPTDCPVTAGSFIRQFAKDLLYGLIGMIDQPPTLQSTAVLAELGEHRRRGNSYSTEDVGAAVSALQSRLPKH